MKSFTKITHAFTKITGLTLFSLFFISCADILKKQNNIQITIPPVQSIQANELPPPLAHANNFSQSSRAGSPSNPSDFYCVFGALCRPLPKHPSGSEQNEVFQMVHNELCTHPLSINYSAYDVSTLAKESSPYDMVLNAIKTYQANDENKEFVALASLNNVLPNKEITLNFPPVEIGQEFYVSVYIMHYFFNDEGVWAEEIYKMYFTAEPIYRFDDYLNTYYFFDNEPKSIRADSNYMVVPLIERKFKM